MHDLPREQGGSRGECRKEGAVYQIKCLKFKGSGLLAEYWGETAKTAYERGETQSAPQRRQTGEGGPDNESHRDPQVPPVIGRSMKGWSWNATELQ